jgi:hypothetical protein
MPVPLADLAGVTVDPEPFMGGCTVHFDISVSSDTPVTSVKIIVYTDTEAFGYLFASPLSGSTWRVTWIAPTGVTINSHYGIDVIIKNGSTEQQDNYEVTPTGKYPAGEAHYFLRFR